LLPAATRKYLAEVESKAVANKVKGI
jgi:hypothetical protein